MDPRGWDERQFALPSLDLPVDLDELRAQAEQERRLSREMGQADHYEGVDQTGSIQVVVDRRGRVVNIGIHPRWKQSVRLDEFAPSLFGCYVRAVGASMSAAALDALDALDAEEGHEPERSAVPRPRDSEPELSEEEWLRRTWAQLYEIEEQLHQIEEMGRAGQPDERLVSGPDGLVTLRLQGSSLVGIDGDLRLMTAADASQLRLDALAAFEAAGLTANGS